MPVDVSTEIVIDRPREEVAAYAADPDNALAWYRHIQRVIWKTPRPLDVGSRVAFLANFLGKQLEYVYEITTLEPGERLVMRTVAGRFPMETIYDWRDEPGGGTRMSLHNRGEPHGFSRLGSLLLRPAMRRANRNDLRRLKELLEARG
jgi:uncharacterized membrane protein